MDCSMIIMASSLLCLLLVAPLAYSQPVPFPSFSPTPAPSPAPDYVNLTNLLSVAGPFHTFLSYLQSTNVIDTFQSQANDTEEGITIFVPKDKSFSSLKKPSLSNLTQDQLKQFLLFHALPHCYTLADFKNLGQLSPFNTFAGGAYTLNFTDVSGTIHIDSGWTSTKVTSSVFSTSPIAFYQVDRVLLPEAIFGTDIPLTPAPSPSPDISPFSDSPSESSDQQISPKSSSHRILNCGIWGHLVLTIVAGWLGLSLVRVCLSICSVL